MILLGFDDISLTFEITAVIKRQYVYCVFKSCLIDTMFSKVFKTWQSFKIGSFQEDFNHRQMPIKLKNA